jgi:hypothetical protein
MKTKLTFIIAFVTMCTMAQERKTLSGTVTVGEARVPGVFVINKNTGDEAKTNSQGHFSILAKSGDKLAVNSPMTQDREFYVSEDTFKKQPYVLAVEASATQLEEVTINDSIKIIQPVKSAAAYTPAERRVNTGAKITTHTMGDYAGGGVAISTDAVLNSGEKRRALRRELQTEQRQEVIESISYNFSNEFIKTTLGIPAEKVEAFLFYAAEDEALQKAIKENNTERARLEIAAVAKEYLNLQQEEGAGAEGE